MQSSFKNHQIKLVLMISTIVARTCHGVGGSSNRRIVNSAITTAFTASSSSTFNQPQHSSTFKRWTSQTTAAVSTGFDINASMKNQLTKRWMSTDATTEKTPEEKEAIKAAREARK